MTATLPRNRFPSLSRPAEVAGRENSPRLIAMTPDELIAILKTATPEQVSEIVGILFRPTLPMSPHQPFTAPANPQPPARIPEPWDPDYPYRVTC